jgi:hypothetical protein
VWYWCTIGRYACDAKSTGPPAPLPNTCAPSPLQGQSVLYQVGLRALLSSMPPIYPFTPSPSPRALTSPAACPSHCLHPQPCCPQAVLYLVDLLQDGNSEVRRVADQCLDCVMDCGEEWALRIRNLKFEAYNQDWLTASAGGPAAGALLGRPGYAGSGAGSAGYGSRGGSGDEGGYTVIGGQRVVDLEAFSPVQRLWEEQGGGGGVVGSPMAVDGGGMGEQGGQEYQGGQEGDEEDQDGYGGEGEYDDEELMRGYVVQ